MKRVFLGEVLQTIYLDIFIQNDSYIYTHQVNTKEMMEFRFPKDVSNLQDIFSKLENLIHPRYTKVIVDSNHDTFKNIIKWIDDKYNNYVSGFDDTMIDEKGIKTRVHFPEQMVEMVQVIKYHPKRIDVKEFMANKTIYLMKNLK